MRRLATFVLSSTYMLAASVPPIDNRLVNVPNTDTKFTPRVYASRAEWEARAAHLRRQILSSAGRLPLPVKTPPNPQIFGRIERKGYPGRKGPPPTTPRSPLAPNPYP